jgi:hypothetical protein
MNDEPIIHFTIESASLEALRAFTDETRPDLGCRAIPKRTDSGYVIDAWLPEPQLEAARGVRSAASVTLTVIENATEVGQERQKEVGTGNRYAARGEVPRGLGKKE